MNFISGQLTRNIETAGHAGFCYGVKRAVETTKKIKKENPDKEVFVLGELIHNSSVIKELEELGIKTVETLPSSAPKGAICIIRSHGEGIDTIEKIKNSGYEVVDLTCLDVKKVQDTAVNLAGEGYFLLILGKAEHPEVMAIKSNAKKYSKDINSPLVIKSLEDLISKSDLIKNKNKIGVVIQTTQRIDFLKREPRFFSGSGAYWVSIRLPAGLARGNNFPALPGAPQERYSYCGGPGRRPGCS